MHKGEVVRHSNFTRNLQELEQFLQFKIFLGHDHAKKRGRFPNLFIFKINIKGFPLHPSCKG
jgi:hypothetical protein